MGVDEHGNVHDNAGRFTGRIQGSADPNVFPGALGAIDKQINELKEARRQVAEEIVSKEVVDWYPNARAIEFVVDFDEYEQIPMFRPTLVDADGEDVDVDCLPDLDDALSQVVHPNDYAMGETIRIDLPVVEIDAAKMRDAFGPMNALAPGMDDGVPEENLWSVVKDPSGRQWMMAGRNDNAISFVKGGRSHLGERIRVQLGKQSDPGRVTAQRDEYNRLPDEMGKALCPVCAYDDRAMRCEHGNMHIQCCTTCGVNV